ncbi:MAG: alpha/beta fold hydrolase, partial [Microbacteriaceae bacterium]|nr:alpha/beta fold hydrolase [Microbacteriaceae bacterium]
VSTFGHDWGGVVSLGWAVGHPEQLVGVMLLNTPVHHNEDEPIPAPLRLALRRSILGRATVSTPAFLETTLALAHPPLSAAIKAGYRAPYPGAERRGGIGGFVADIPADAGHESFAELDRIATGIRTLGVPSLLLWGPRDPIFSDRYLDDLLERMPRSDVHRFEGAGHLIAEDADYPPAALAWLRDLRADSVSDSASDAASDAASDGASGGASDGTSDGAHRNAGPDYQPLWHYLDELRDSDDTALVEMAPSGSAMSRASPPRPTQSRPTSPRAAQSRPTSPRVVSWRLLSRRVRELAAGLDRAGVRRGDRVSLLVPPGADLTAVLYACVRIGAIVVVADAGLGLRGLTRAVRGARPDHVIGQARGLTAALALGWPGRRISTTRLPEPVRRGLGVTHCLADLVEIGGASLAAGTGLPPAPGPDDAAAVLFTSGSTGPAKGVVYTHAQLSGIRFALAGQYGVGPGTGLVAGFAPFALLGPALGARSATPDMDVTSPGTLTATAVADAVAAVDGTVVFLSPAAIANVVATASDLGPAHRASLAGVREFLSAGAPVSEPLLAAAARLMPGAVAHTPYGMTEGLLLTDITLDGIRDAVRDAGLRGGADAGGVCVGQPTATTAVRISAIDGLGAPIGEPSRQPNVTGEIVVSAPHIKNGYDRLWITDRASRVGTAPGERWHRTGDVGHLDDAGRLWVEGRLPHVVVTASGVVTPVATEQRIEGIASVARAAIVGVGPRGTQQLVAIIETVAGSRRVALATFELAAAVRRAAVPPLAAVLVVPNLPTDIRHNSKIDRTRLAAWATGVLSGGAMRQP